MTATQDFQLPPLAAFGIRVRDLDTAIDLFSDILGTAPFEEVVFEPDKHWYKGKLHPIKLRIASFEIGTGLKVDLIEDLNNGPHQWRIDEHGEGLDYMCFHVDDYDLGIAHMREQGFGILSKVETMLDVKVSAGEPPVKGLLSAAYLVSDKIENLIIEIGNLKQV